MGKQARIQTKRIISRAELPLYGYDCSDIEEFLTDTGCLTTYIFNGDYIDYLPTWEIDKSQLKQVIKELITDKSDEKIAGDYTARELANMFSSWLKLTDNKENFSDSDYIYIDWY